MCIDCLNEFKQTTSLEISVTMSDTCCKSLKGKIKHRICFLIQEEEEEEEENYFNLSCTNNFPQSSFVFKYSEVRKCIN